MGEACTLREIEKFIIDRFCCVFSSRFWDLGMLPHMSNWPNNFESSRQWGPQRTSHSHLQSYLFPARFILNFYVPYGCWQTCRRSSTSISSGTKRTSGMSDSSGVGLAHSAIIRMRLALPLHTLQPYALICRYMAPLTPWVPLLCALDQQLIVSSAAPLTNGGYYHERERKKERERWDARAQVTGVLVPNLSHTGVN